MPTRTAFARLGRVPRLPQRHRSYAVLRFPASIGRGSGSPCRCLPQRRALVLSRRGREPASVPVVGRWVTGSPEPRIPLRGEVRASQVSGPPSYAVPRSSTPPDPRPPRPSIGGRDAAFRHTKTLGIRNDLRFEAAFPRPDRSPTYASPRWLPTTSQGWPPACWAPLWPDRIRTCWTTDRISRKSHLLPSLRTSLPGRF